MKNTHIQAIDFSFRENGDAKYSMLATIGVSDAFLARPAHERDQLIREMGQPLVQMTLLGFTGTEHKELENFVKSSCNSVVMTLMWVKPFSELTEEEKEIYNDHYLFDLDFLISTGLRNVVWTTE